jgi:predicted RNA-binding protein with PIN domain
MPPRAKYLIVDGHSMIFQWPELRTLHQRRSGAAREELIRLLTQYQDSSGVHVVAVFDGRGAKPSEDSTPGGIQVFYSRSGQTADEIVERLCARYAREHDITVATDDLLERQTSLTFGASTISSRMLKELLDDAQADLQRRIAGRRRQK